MNKKRSFIVFLITVLFFALVGCSNSSSDENESSGSADKGDPVTLTLWHIDEGAREEAILNAVKRFEDKNEGVKVDVVRQKNDQYKTKLSVSMGGGTPPDVFHSWGGGWLEEFVKADQVKELTADVDLNNYLESSVGPAIFDKKVYGLPMIIEFVPVWYNKDIFKKYGIEEPKTYDELLTIVETLKSNDIIPFSLANQPKWPGAMYMMYFAERAGGPDLFKEAYGRTGRGFDDEAYVEAGKKIQELVKLGAFPEGLNGMSYDNGQSRQLMYSGKAAMEVQVSSYLDNVRNEMPEFEEKLGFFLFPALEGGKGAQNHIVGGTSPVFSVSEKSANQDLALELAKELASVDSGQDLADLGGGIGAAKGVEYKDEYLKKLSDAISGAEFIQTYYDQTLPPEVAQAHLDTTQGLLGLTITPEDAAKQVEAKAKEVIK